MAYLLDPIRIKYPAEDGGDVDMCARMAPSPTPTRSRREHARVTNGHQENTQGRNRLHGRHQGLGGRSLLDFSGTFALSLAIGARQRRIRRAAAGSWP